MNAFPDPWHRGQRVFVSSSSSVSAGRIVSLPGDLEQVEVDARVLEGVEDGRCRLVERGQHGANGSADLPPRHLAVPVLIEACVLLVYSPGEAWVPAPADDGRVRLADERRIENLEVGVLERVQLPGR